ncbi:MAG: GNAT family N-acetyltransferase [Chloroflexi bacterium]|nr:GNAT family N-acetyltransferase [Chloroflexota bacterium]
MQVRPAEPRDLEACVALNHSYTTDHVWQMDTRGENGLLTTTFRLVRLPRETRVNYPLQGDYMLVSWRRRDGFMVAEDGEGICGYVTLTAHVEHGIAWIGDLVVDLPQRRRGIGTLLLQAAVRWGQDQNLVRLVAKVQTKNHPATQFYQSHGLTFCGYNDHYWPNQDIALFFGKSLR